MPFTRTLARLGLMLLGIVAFVVVLAVVQTPMHRAGVPDALAGIVLTPLCLALYAAWVRFVERRRVDELTLRAAVPEASAGAALGIALMALTIGVMAVAGVYRIAGFGGWPGLLPAALIGLAIATSEEIVFRGFLFRVVRDVGGTWTAVVVSAVVFGALHAFNPGASPVSTVAIALEAGVLLALAYAATDRLWLPIGIHFGWNFAEGPIFGTSVSGGASAHGLLRGELHGPSALTGGAFGPEASIVAVAICLAAAAGLALLAGRRRHERRPKRIDETRARSRALRADRSLEPE